MAFSPETYALLKAQGGGGGSALPTPTAANVGQALVVKPKQVAIVPEQSVAITQANDYRATLSNSNLSQLVAGWTYSVKIGSEEFTANAFDDGGYNMLATFTGDTTFWFWHDPDLNSDIVATDDSPFSSVSVAVTGGSATEIEYGLQLLQMEVVFNSSTGEGDKTWAEVTEAMAKGVRVFAKFELLNYKYVMTALYYNPSDYSVCFCGYIDNGNICDFYTNAQDADSHLFFEP